MIVTLKLCIACWNKRTGNDTAVPAKITLGRECYDCHLPSTNLTLVPYEVDIPKPFERQ